MTTEQLKELSECLTILSGKSSVLKERRELRALMEENLQADEVSSRHDHVGTANLSLLICRIPSHPLGL